MSRHREVHVHVHDDGGFSESDHPRADNGEFSTTGGAHARNSAASLNEGAAAIAKMSEDERDNLDPAKGPGGWHAYNLYEARKMMPKPSDKLKKISDRNSFALHQDYEYLANVEGQHYGVFKRDDPDADEDNEDEDGNVKQFVYTFQSLEDPLGSETNTLSADKDDLFAAMRKHKEQQT